MPHRLLIHSAIAESLLLFHSLLELESRSLTQLLVLRASIWALGSSALHVDRSIALVSLTLGPAPMRLSWRVFHRATGARFLTSLSFSRTFSLTGYTDTHDKLLRVFDFAFVPVNATAYTLAPAHPHINFGTLVPSVNIRWARVPRGNEFCYKLLSRLGASEPHEYVTR